MATKQLWSLARFTAAIMLSGLASMPSTASGAPVQYPGHYTSPKSLTLTLRDLPRSLGSGFRQSGEAITNAQVAATELASVATINQHGRITGYETDFRRHVSKGVLAISDTVGAYRTAGDAHWEYTRFTGLYPAPAGSHRISLSGVGNEARGYTEVGSRTSVLPPTAHIFFRRGAYTVRLDMSGIGAMPVADFVRLAQTLDGRIRRAK